jgi:uncharacterized protein (DUF169 family)
MDAGAIKSILKNELGIRTELIALKQTKEEPEKIIKYGDMNNICYMFGEVLEEGKTFYTTLKDHVCLLGCVATGLDPTLETINDKQRQDSEDFHVGSINIFPTEELQAKAEREAEKLFPKFQETFKAVIIGPFGNVPDPDVLIILCNPEQAHLLTRSYCYATGSIIKGYAGMGVCRMILPHAFIDKEPSFTVSDRAWRRALKVAQDQLTLVTPPEKLVIMLENLEASKQ